MNHTRGQTVLEAIVALGIVTTGVVALLVLVSRGVGLGRVVADRYTATYLAAEGIEMVKTLITTNVLRAGFGCTWNGGGAGCNNLSDGDYSVDFKRDEITTPINPLIFDPAAKMYTIDSVQDGVASPFSRVVTIRNDSLEENMTVTARVNWTSRGGDYEVVLEDHFYNWQ